MLTENSVIIPTNEYQTPITKELLDRYPAEVQEQFLEFVDTVPLIKYMIGTDRKRAKDLPKDSKGRIIVDITHPHILENMDYFRPAGLFYKENGCYTLLKENSNPNSEYGKWLKEEFRRCRDGYVRESDGEWVTGYMYWVLNYNPIMLNRLDEDSGIYIRQEDFPDFWEGIYYRFHYLDQARHAGKHGMELARRGASKAHPYSEKVITPEGEKLWGDITVGDYLFGDDGKPTKVVDIPFDGDCDTYRITLRDGRSVLASDEHLWKVKVHRHKDMEIYSTKELYNIYARKHKVTDRNPNGVEYICGIPVNGAVEFGARDILIDPYTLGVMLGDGCFTTGSCYLSENSEDFSVISKHIPYSYVKWSNYCSYRLDIPNWRKSLEAYGLADMKSADKFIPDDYKYNTEAVRRAVLMGIMDTDGFLGKHSVYMITTASKQLASDIRFICWSLGYNTTMTEQKAGYKKNGEYVRCHNVFVVSIHTDDCLTHLPRKTRKNYTSNYAKNRAVQSRIVNIEYVGKMKSKCVTVDNKSHCYLINDFVITHNSFSLASIMSHNLILGENAVAKSRVTTILTASTKEYLSDKDGTFTKFTPMIDFVFAHTEFPKLFLKRSPSEMIWRMGYKNSNGNELGSLNAVMGLSTKDDEGKIRGKRGYILFEEMGNFPNFKEVWNNVRDSVKEGSHVFSLLFAVGTAGDDASDFSGVQTILYHPSSFEVYALENVYDRVGKGTKQFSYFFPSYISRAGCMDKDGNSDVVKALLEILMERWTVKQSGDAASLLSRTAQMPITPAEAILKVKSNFFPVTMLTERLRQIDQDPHFYDDVYVGTLIEVNGNVEFRATDDVPLRQWKVDNSNQGALEIYEMPPAIIPLGRYVIGCLTEGQMVTTDSGLKAVETITLTDKLLNKDGEYVSIKNLQRRYKHDEPVYSIKLVDVYDRVELTGNHPVYAATPKKCYHGWKYHLKTGEPAVYYKYDFGFKRADELRIGDVVKSPTPYFDERPIPFDKWEHVHRKGVHSIKNPLASEKFWWIVGLVLGDGWCRNSIVCVSFNSKERQCISRFKNAVASVFHKNVLLVKDRGTCVEYQFYCLQFSMFFTKWFGKYASGKHISEWVKYLPKSCRLALLTGYLDSDGCCTENTMEFVSVSKKLLCDVQDILLSLGIISGLKKLRDSRTFRFGTSWANYESECKPTYSLAVARAGVEKFSELLGGMDLKLRRFNHRPTANHAIKRCWFSDDGRYIYYKITDISVRNYTGIVYNFECDTHTYMCNRLPVHNCDPVDNDQAESTSFSSNIVFDLFTDKIVAEFTGRLPFADDNFEMLRLLGLFYKATIMVEANKKGYYSYFAKKHCIWMLADCPEYLRDRQLVKYSMFGSAQKGITVNAAIISFANGLIKDWLLKTYTAEFKDEKGEVTVQSVPNVYRLRNRALIEELIGYAPEVNTDRVSALAQVMLFREQYLILYGGSPEADGADNQTPAEDDFFDRDWKRKQDRLTNRMLL